MTAKVSAFQRLAAVDNAEWCCAMWRAHGLEVERLHGAVACVGAPPRFYPNVVTVDPGADSEPLVAWLSNCARPADADFFVKDSFQALRLNEVGFERLFDAVWIRRGAREVGALASLTWRTVRTPSDLEAWERAWSDGGANAEPRLFLPGLLSEPHVQVMAGWRGGVIASGCVLSQTGAVVGVSNVFGDQREVLNAAARVAADRDLVGYEQGDDLAGALAAGFEAVGDLAVWVRRAWQNFR